MHVVRLDCNAAADKEEPQQRRTGHHRSQQQVETDPEHHAGRIDAQRFDPESPYAIASQVHREQAARPQAPFRASFQPENETGQAQIPQALVEKGGMVSELILVACRPVLGVYA